MEGKNPAGRYIGRSVVFTGLISGLGFENVEKRDLAFIVKRCYNTHNRNDFLASKEEHEFANAFCSLAIVGGEY